mmetsp:Transcript_2878/g.10423  ORF Transcript_2878/g.10423 Transcript_2878/m.10423 type:complete len:295 (+) Transcript_2878:2304-3188(+)
MEPFHFATREKSVSSNKVSSVVAVDGNHRTHVRAPQVQLTQRQNQCQHRRNDHRARPKDVVPVEVSRHALGGDDVNVEIDGGKPPTYGDDFVRPLDVHIDVDADVLHRRHYTLDESGGCVVEDLCRAVANETSEDGDNGDRGGARRGVVTALFAVPAASIITNLARDAPGEPTPLGASGAVGETTVRVQRARSLRASTDVCAVVLRRHFHGESSGGVIARAIPCGPIRARVQDVQLARRIARRALRVVQTRSEPLVARLTRIERAVSTQRRRRRWTGRWCEIRRRRVRSHARDG